MSCPDLDENYARRLLRELAGRSAGVGEITRAHERLRTTHLLTHEIYEAPKEFVGCPVLSFLFETARRYAWSNPQVATMCRELAYAYSNLGEGPRRDESALIEDDFVLALTFAEQWEQEYKEHQDNDLALALMLAEEMADPEGADGAADGAAEALNVRAIKTYPAEVLPDGVRFRGKLLRRGPEDAFPDDSSGDGNLCFYKAASGQVRLSPADLKRVLAPHANKIRERLGLSGDFARKGEMASNEVVAALATVFCREVVVFCEADPKKLVVYTPNLCGTDEPIYIGFQPGHFYPME